MNINDCRYVLAVVEEGSITKAAKKLFITQPALSQRIKWIRDNYGIDIFKYDADGAHLTRAGECFVKYAKEIVNCEINLVHELSDLSRLQSGTLCVGISQLANSAFLQRIVYEFHTSFPDVQLNFIEEPSYRLEPYLLSNKIELAIFHLPSSKKLNYEFLFNDRIVVIPRKGNSWESLSYHKEGEATPYIFPQILANEPLALPDAGTMLFSRVAEAFESVNLTPKAHYRSKNYHALSCFADTGLASAIVLESFLSYERIHSPHYYLDATTAAHIPYGVVWAQERHTNEISKHFIQVAMHAWQYKNVPIEA